MTLGTLTHEAALALHAAGCSRAVIAKRAGVHPGTVTRWRAKNRLARPYVPTGMPTADRRAYQREWKRLRAPQRTAQAITGQQRLFA